MSHLSSTLEEFSPDDPLKAKFLFYKEPHKNFLPRWEFQDKENINQQNCEIKSAKMSKFLKDFFFCLIFLTVFLIGCAAELNACTYS